MTSEEINTIFFSDLFQKNENEKFFVSELFGSGKKTPYVGWFWRYVDFDKLFVLYFPDPDLEMKLDVPRWYGFMENNKWDYSEVQPTNEDCLIIKNYAIEVAKNPCKETYQVLYDIIQQIGKRSQISYKGSKNLSYENEINNE